MKRLILIVAAIATVSCGSKKQKPLTPDELYNECATGVVMVLNHYYTELLLPNGKTYLWSENYGDRGFAEDSKAILEYRDSKIGTGFFISAVGEIITDLSVIDPSVDGAKIRAGFSTLCKDNLDKLKEILSSSAESLKKVETRIASAEFWSQTPAESDIAERDRLTALYNDTEKECKEWEELSFDAVKMRIVSDLRIAYNNAVITNLNDLEEAEWLEAEIGDKNIATIQLKSRAPIPNTHIFNIDYEGKEVTNEETGRPVYMIYFVGEYDALTPIKAKLATGKTVKSPSDVGNIRYSLPITAITGAPILNEFGELMHY